MSPLKSGEFRPCQITEDSFVDPEQSMHIQKRAVVSNEYTIREGTEPLGGGETQNDGWLHEWFGSTEARAVHSFTSSTIIHAPGLHPSSRVSFLFFFHN